MSFAAGATSGGGAWQIVVKNWSETVLGDASSKDEDLDFKLVRYDGVAQNL